MTASTANRWRGPGGYRAVLAVGLPLVCSMVSHTVMQFTDRVFLGNYSLTALAAAFPAGMASFLLLSFFLGLVRYVAVFVAQYTGAGNHAEVGSVLWQGIYLALAAGVGLGVLSLVARPLFAFAGHAPEIRHLEEIYFQILCAGAGIPLLAVCLSGFFTGRGLTWPVAAANALGAAVNIPLDYALINGSWGLPEWGVAGAGIATVASSAVTLAVLARLVFTPANRQRYGLARRWRFDPAQARRLLYFGLPGGAHFFIDMFGLAFFAFMMGRLGGIALATSNIVISIELLAFLPLIGLSHAASVLVGQAVGSAAPQWGGRATASALHLGMACMTLAAIVFLAFPEPLLALFRPRGMPPAAFRGMVEDGTVLLRYVAFYCLAYSPALVWLEALKGAGDSRFVMGAVGLCSLLFWVVPTYVLVEHLRTGLYGPWRCTMAYVALLTLVAGWRFYGGKWKEMSVIAPAAAPSGP